MTNPSALERALFVLVGERIGLSFPRGDEGDPWHARHDEDQQHPFGFEAIITAVDRDGDGLLCVDTDEGMRFAIAEDRPVAIVVPPASRKARL